MMSYVLAKILLLMFDSSLLAIPLLSPDSGHRHLATGGQDVGADSNNNINQKNY